MTMSKDDDICWYHPNLSRETAEKKLLEGKASVFK